MAVRKILMLKKEGKIWTFLLENDVIAEIHSTDNLYSEIFTSEK